MDTLTQLLLQISNALLYPVVIGLLLLAALALTSLGGLGAEAVDRLRNAGALRAFVLRLQQTPDLTPSVSDIPARFGLPKVAFTRITAHSGDLDKSLDDLQLDTDRRLSRLSLGVRLGPILGLAGTLIPLGPALVTLSSGDVGALSQRLIVAFATTVIGLMVGGVCYVLHTLRRHWYMQDLNDIEYIARRLKAHETTPAPARQ